jgi:hypothetical protein
VQFGGSEPRRLASPAAFLQRHSSLRQWIRAGNPVIDGRLVICLISDLDRWRCGPASALFLPKKTIINLS